MPPTLLDIDAPDDVTRVLADRLTRVQQRFDAELLSDLDCVNELARYVERYRGKMLRPTLTLLSVLAGYAPDTARGNGSTPPDEQAVVLAAVFEMVHMATLVHDDILDEAQVRRRGATINHLRGNETAVMLGDYLISHAYHLCCSLDRPAIARAVAATTNTVCEGELLQLSNRQNWELDERTYFEIIRRKTAALCEACCRLPALLYGASIEGPLAEALGGYGAKVGVAFQIIDDVLDLVGDERAVGKSLGRDLAKGKLTLPLIHWLSTTPPASRPSAVAALERVAAGGGLGPLRRQVRESAGVDYARGRAAALVTAASADLCDHLPDSPARRLLLEMARAVLDRRR